MHVHVVGRTCIVPVWSHVLAVALQLLLLLAALLLINHVSAWTVTAPGPLQLVVVSCRYYLLSRYLHILEPSLYFNKTS